MMMLADFVHDLQSILLQKKHKVGLHSTNFAFVNNIGFLAKYFTSSTMADNQPPRRNFYNNYGPPQKKDKKSESGKGTHTTFLFHDPEDDTGKI